MVGIATAYLWNMKLKKLRTLWPEDIEDLGVENSINTAVTGVFSYTEQWAFFFERVGRLGRY